METCARFRLLSFPEPSVGRGNCNVPVLIPPPLYVTHRHNNVNPLPKGGGSYGTLFLRYFIIRVALN